MSTPYAIDQLRSLINAFPQDADASHAFVRYVCALLCELAYYHITELELDAPRRAMLVPCDAFRELFRQGKPTDVLALLRGSDADFEATFVVTTRTVVVIGIKIERQLFIAFRGTGFLFDWRTNLRCGLASLHVNLAQFHGGFLEEVIRIMPRVRKEIHKMNGGAAFDKVYVTGHSLGGAVAGIFSYLFNHSYPGPQPITVLFASPRYTTHAGYLSDHPAQIRRPGDVVPVVPPRLLGYIDHPFEFQTSGKEYFDPRLFATFFVGEAIRMVLFLLRCFKPHSMELYRIEIGEAAHGPNYPVAKLIDVERLTLAHIKSSLASNP